MGGSDHPTLSLVISVLNRLRKDLKAQEEELNSHGDAPSNVVSAAVGRLRDELEYRCDMFKCDAAMCAGFLNPCTAEKVHR